MIRPMVLQCPPGLRPLLFDTRPRHETIVALAGNSIRVDVIRLVAEKIAAKASNRNISAVVTQRF